MIDEQTPLVAGPVRRALVLEGGGARGAFEAGALLYIHDHPDIFAPEIVTGTSVGALNAAGFAYGLTPELSAAWCRITSSQVYRGRSLLHHAFTLLIEKRFTHLYDTAPLQRLLGAFFGSRNLMDCPLRLKITSFNLQTGASEVFDNESPVRLVDALMASCALQALFPPYSINGFQYIDGGNGANLPLRPALQAGATDLVLVRSAADSALNPWLYRDMVNIQKRAHLALMSHITSSDLARAREISDLLRRYRRQRMELRSAIEEVVSSEEQRLGLLRMLDAQRPLSRDKRPVRMRVIAPPPGARMPAVLDFDPEMSLGLMRLGYLEAKRILERSKRPLRGIHRRMPHV